MAYFAYSVYGMHIASAIALPLPAPSSEGGQPDVYIRLGDVPVTLDDAAVSTPVIQARSNAFLFTLPGVGRFCVRGGQEVWVQPEDGVPEGIISLHLLHTAFVALLHQRGLLPLHASGVIVDGGCVAFLGGPAEGKSTLAAALWQRGYRVLCDDICAVTLTEGIATVYSGIRQLQLWPDAIESLGLSKESAQLAHPEGRRYTFPDDVPIPDQAYPLVRLYMLREARVDPAGITRIRGSEAFMSLLPFAHCQPYVAAVSGKGGHFSNYAGIAQTVPIFVWRYHRGLEHLDAALDPLEKHLKSQPA